MIPVEVKGGPSYTIDFIANLTQPELALSSDNLDFEKVLLNTRKTVKLRISNDREVPCEWWYMEQGGNVSKDGLQFFEVRPKGGILQPGARSTIDVMFIPNADKQFSTQLTFRCRENSKQFKLNVRGQGINN